MRSRHDSQSHAPAPSGCYSRWVTWHYDWLTLCRHGPRRCNAAGSDHEEERNCICWKCIKKKLQSPAITLALAPQALRPHAGQAHVSRHKPCILNCWLLPVPSEHLSCCPRAGALRCGCKGCCQDESHVAVLLSLSVQGHLTLGAIAGSAARLKTISPSCLSFEASEMGSVCRGCHLGIRYRGCEPGSGMVWQQRPSQPLPAGPPPSQMPSCLALLAWLPCLPWLVAPAWPPKLPKPSRSALFLSLVAHARCRAMCQHLDTTKAAQIHQVSPFSLL